MPASQAGRRRFDPGRPLHPFPKYSNPLDGGARISPDPARAPSPIHHPKPAEKKCLTGRLEPARLRARRIATALLVSVKFVALRLSPSHRNWKARGVSALLLFPRAALHGVPARARRARSAANINPERFAELPAADAGAGAGELEGGESTNGPEPSRAESRDRGDEATEVRGTAWRSARIV